MSGRLSSPLASRLLFGLLTAASLAAFLLPFWSPAGEDASLSRTALLLFSGSVALILVALIAEAQQGLTAHTVAMIGTLIGLNLVLRVIDATLIPLPGGFSPVFLLIVLVGYVFGARLGFLMGALTMLVSDPVTPGGLGPWTPYQMLAAGWMGMAAAWLPHGRWSIAWLASYSAIWGLLYGALTQIYFWPYALSAPDLGWAPGLNTLELLIRYGRYYLVSSLAWDSMRLIGNVVLILTLGPGLIKALERFQRRARVVWDPA
jgi:energy-coupling factor transport system substrate-specific component